MLSKAHGLRHCQNWAALGGHLVQALISGTPMPLCYFTLHTEPLHPSNKEIMHVYLCLGAASQPRSLPYIIFYQPPYPRSLPYIIFYQAPDP
jgi:hypothetical protein